mmetsp:Transcript_35958/g.101202  ORF Transcript_35958/g.101202 Transcript_35958/m.101202 type:complete len:216 (-) Transcript_35958:403-1050(-)
MGLTDLPSLWFCRGETRSLRGLTSPSLIRSIAPSFRFGDFCASESDTSERARRENPVATTSPSLTSGSKRDRSPSPPPPFCSAGLTLSEGLRRCRPRPAREVAPMSPKLTAEVRVPPSSSSSPSVSPPSESESMASPEKGDRRCRPLRSRCRPLCPSSFPNSVSSNATTDALRTCRLFFSLSRTTLVSGSCPYECDFRGLRAPRSRFGVFLLGTA